MPSPEKVAPATGEIVQLYDVLLGSGSAEKTEALSDLQTVSPVQLDKSPSTILAKTPVVVPLASVTDT